MENWHRVNDNPAHTLSIMKTNDTTQDTERNIIDATEALKSKRTRGSASLAGLKLLKKPALEKEESKIIDLYIAARRREQAAAVTADELKPQVLHIVKTHQQSARRGALVSLDHSYRWHYSGNVTRLAKTLSDERETRAGHPQLRRNARQHAGEDRPRPRVARSNALRPVHQSVRRHRSFHSPDHRRRPLVKRGRQADVIVDGAPVQMNDREVVEGVGNARDRR